MGYALVQGHSRRLKKRQGTISQEQGQAVINPCSEHGDHTSDPGTSVHLTSAANEQALVVRRAQGRDAAGLPTEPRGAGASRERALLIPAALR